MREESLEGDFTVSCPECGESYGPGDTVKLYDYALKKTADGTVIQAGTLELVIDDYIRDSGRYKYCLVCYAMKPLDAFSNHRRRKTGRQGECRLCKTMYNSIKNQSRTGDQHKEASQKRRLLVELGGTTRFDESVVRARFSDKCFKCDKDVSEPGQAQFDHTLPVRYFWPMTTQNATLLCRAHNGEKGAKWPSEFYDDAELRQLSLLTGLEYDLLRGPIVINPDAILALREGEFVDRLIQKFAHYMNEIFLIRNRILDLASFDFFEESTNISPTWKDRANELRPSQSATTSE